MSKRALQSVAAGTCPTVRHVRHEYIGHVIRCLQEAGPGTVHTVRSTAVLMYGDDCILEPRHLWAARRMIDKIQKLKLPLEPCDEAGVLISKSLAKARAKRGIAGRYRYYAAASVLGEAILEGMGNRPLENAAIAVLALESAAGPSFVGVAEVKMFFDAVRGWIPESAFQAAEKQLAARRRARAADPLTTAGAPKAAYRAPAPHSWPDRPTTAPQEPRFSAVKRLFRDRDGKKS